jgi:hypothetical protein
LTGVVSNGGGGARSGKAKEEDHTTHAEEKRQKRSQSWYLSGLKELQEFAESCASKKGCLTNVT